MAVLAQSVDERLSDPGWVAGQPPRYDAYLAFAAGLDLWYGQGNAPEALAAFRRAAALDSAYAQPLIWAAWVYGALAMCDSARAMEARLAGIPLTRVEVPELEHALTRCRGDFPASYALAQRMVEVQPASENLRQALAIDALLIGRPREALAILRELNPEQGSLRGRSTYSQYVAVAYHWLGDHERELEAALHGRPGANRIRVLRALAALGRKQEIDASLDQLAASPLDTRRRLQGTAMREAALELAAHGHPDEGRAVLARELTWLRGLPPWQQRTERVRFELAQAHYAAGASDSARAVVILLARDHPESDDYNGLLGVLAAQRGDRAEAARIDSVLGARERPRGTAAFWRAAIAARLGDLDRAVAALGRAQAQGFILFLNMHDPTTFHLVGAHVEPSFDGMRDYPPFAVLLGPQG